MNYTAVALDAAIWECVGIWRMYRRLRWAGWPMSPAAEHLRLLFAIRRDARALAKTHNLEWLGRYSESHPKAEDAFIADGGIPTVYLGWTEAELRTAFGK